MAIDELILLVGDHQFHGWTATRVSRGVERMPSDFDIEMTARFPGDLDLVLVKPGDQCQVFLGDDLVITGYVDVLESFLNDETHTVRVMGRGKCEDLVDCSAEWPGGQISGTSALDVATKLAKPYGIEVTLNGPKGPTIPQINLILGQTAWAVIERVCRYAQLLAYEQPDGSLLLAEVGQTLAASGATEGENVLQAQSTFRMDNRYSQYNVYLQSVDTLSDTGAGGNQYGQATDQGVPRHRRLDSIALSGGLGRDVALAQAQWNRSRRVGRSMQLSCTVDSWRDFAGDLWKPNTLIPLDLPNLRVSQQLWAISEVSYLMDEQGTRAELVVMPPSGFMPKPVQWLPTFAELG